MPNLPSGFQMLKIIVPNMPSVDYPAIQRRNREQDEVDSGYAYVMHDRLMHQIAEFESQLEEDEEIAAYLSSFGSQILVQIDSLDYHDPYLIIFRGLDISNNNRVQLVQHTSQISVLFAAVKVKENRKPRRIGFRTSQIEKKWPIIANITQSMFKTIRHCCISVTLGAMPTSTTLLPASH